MFYCYTLSTGWSGLNYRLWGLLALVGSSITHDCLCGDRVWQNAGRLPWTPACDVL